MTETELLAEAAERGRSAGESAATWVELSESDARSITTDIDPEVMDRYAAPNWLSGENAGESIPELLGDLLDQAPLGEETIMVTYESAADAAFWEEVNKLAHAQLQ